GRGRAGRQERRESSGQPTRRYVAEMPGHWKIPIALSSTVDRLIIPYRRGSGLQPRGRSPMGNGAGYF
ncbi:MAG: hypothetical protein AAB254_11640, partial [candidate division NC10 bacterium]